MLRKLWLERELRWIFPLLPAFLIVLTLEYSVIAQRGWIMAFHEGPSIGLHVTPDTPTAEEVASFLKEHPTGQIISLKENPSSYFQGFDGLARTFLPYLIVFLCVGGILCEKSSGTASFVLSLPASRSSWLWSRAATLFFLTFLTAFLATGAAFLLATRMGIHQNAGWIVAESLRLTMVASPWIGLSLFLQSLLAGRFDKSNEAGITVAVMLFVVFINSAILAFLSPTEFDAYAWYIATMSHSSSAMSWASVLIANAIGAAGLMLAARRFERMDF